MASKTMIRTATIFEKDDGVVAGETLSSKLASLNLNSVINNMSTPPALISPSKKSKQSYPMLPPKQYDGFCLKTIREDDKDDVLAFLNKFFFLDEPLNVSLKMLDGPNDRCLELEHFCLKSLYQHVSVMAVNDKSEIIGLMLGEVVHKDQPEEESECKHVKFKKILDLMEICDKRVNLFEYFPGSKSFFDLKILTVDGSYRNRGIGAALTNRVFEIGRALKVDFLKVVCTSYFTSKICQKLGFTRVVSQDYADHKVDGEVVFKTAEPHKALTIDVYKL